MDPLALEGLPDDRRGDGEEGEGDDGGEGPGLAVERHVPDGSPGEHQAEEQEHDDGTDVDEHLHPGDELGEEQQEEDRGSGQDGEQVEGAVDEVARW